MIWGYHYFRKHPYKGLGTKTHLLIFCPPLSGGGRLWNPCALFASESKFQSGHFNQQGQNGSLYNLVAIMTCIYIYTSNDMWHKYIYIYDDKYTNIHLYNLYILIIHESFDNQSYCPNLKVVGWSRQGFPQRFRRILVPSPHASR